jgi:hypothetical protein
MRAGVVCRQMADEIVTAVAACTEAETSAEQLAVARRQVLDLEEEVRYAWLTHVRRTECRHHSRLLECPRPGSVPPCTPRRLFMLCGGSSRIGGDVALANRKPRRLSSRCL